MSNGLANCASSVVPVLSVLSYSGGLTDIRQQPAGEKLAKSGSKTRPRIHWCQFGMNKPKSQSTVIPGSCGVVPCYWNTAVGSLAR